MLVFLMVWVGSLGDGGEIFTSPGADGLEGALFGVFGCGLVWHGHFGGWLVGYRVEVDGVAVDCD